MQTQCPHCDTRFRVTEAQVSMADGYVRCGVCKEVFNAYEVADNAALKAEKQPSLLDDSEAVQHDEDQAVSTEATATELLATDITDDNNEIDDEITGSAPAVSEIDFNDTGVTAQSRKDTFDFFDEEANQPLEHVVPDTLRNDHAGSTSSVIATVMWSIAILLMTTALVVQYAWFNRDQFNQAPEIQALTEALCKQFSCEGIELRVPEKIELISRNVYSHPNEKDALMVNITMKNIAEFTQPYPVLQIDFSDIRGSKVAARRFKPAEYIPELANAGGQRATLPPDTAIDITLEIRDPGTEAMTYEFNFL